jgi:hypothetical protein
MSEDAVQVVDDMNPVVCELELRKSQKEDSIGVIQRLRIKPTSKSRLSIPLCRLRALPLVRPISEVEVQCLECEFVMGYQEGDRVLYVSGFNDVPVDLPIPPGIMASWSPLWQEASAEFDSKLKEDPDLAHFAGKMFFVWEGNHRLTAWWRHINNHHADDKSWHISVDCIIVDPRGYTGVFLNAMSDINW